MSSQIEATSRVRIEARLRHADGSVLDPTTLDFTLRQPSGELVNYQYGIHSQVVKLAVGHYYVDWDANQVGVYRFRWQATGAVVASQSGAFSVRAAQI
jgi:hypothetical protein